ncbi:MAG: hypothetical protein AAFO57_00180 [Pseudomonadota bacterium]
MKRSVFSSKIARMSLRRQKIAIKRVLVARLTKFVGRPNTPDTMREIQGAIYAEFRLEVPT